MLHDRVAPQTLGFARTWVFGLCWINVWRRQLSELAELPPDLCVPVGVLSFLPESAFAGIWTASFLSALRLFLLSILAAVVLGLRPYRLLATTACAAFILQQSVIRSYGHIHHSQLALLYTAMLLALFPAADGFALSRGPRLYASPAAYRAPLVGSALLLCMTYAFVGVRRFCSGGAQIFLDQSIIHMAVHRSIAGGSFGTDYGLLVLDYPWLGMALQISFPLITAMEVAAPLCLFCTPFRRIWIVVMLAFHVLSRIFLQVWFVENVLLIPVLLLDIDRLFGRAQPDD